MVAIRPHLVWGPGDTQLVGRIVERARAGRLPRLGSGAALIDTTYIDNAASALAAALERAEDVHGRAYVVTNGEPRPVAELKAELARFSHLEEVRWVQDEPANMGAWPHYALNLTPELDGLPFRRVSRPESSSPSVGQHSRHLEEQKAIIEQAFS